MRGAGRFAAALAAVMGAAAFAAPANAADPRSTIVDSFDDTPIITNYFKAPGLESGQKRPTILVGHGWGGSGATDPADGSVAPYLEAGYNVLTWDARGFGGSGGTVQIDDPRFEARDVQALITYVAKRPSAKLEKRGDPVVGMSGGSYGGGIQFITAARDKRVDAITPDIAWHTLNRSLYQRRAIKLGWDLALIGAGIPTSVAPGVFSPAGVQTGNQSRFFYDALTSGTTTGTLRPGVQKWFRRHGPAQYLKQVDVPTLITQGTVDTLFTLTESVKNYRSLMRNDIPLKMSWHCGGHGVCFTDAGPEGHLTDRRVAWFDRYLKHRKVKTGPRFEWVDEEGSLHRSTRFELGKLGDAVGTASGQLVLTPGVQPSGALIAATPAPPGPGVLNVPIDGVEAGDHILGAPKLTLRYTASGTGIPPGRLTRTYLYAQLVDDSRGPMGGPAGTLVVGNQATPVPIALDLPNPGSDPKTRKVSIPLETVASVAGEEGYTLQIVSQSTLYDIQRALADVDIKSAKVELPVAD